MAMSTAQVHAAQDTSDSQYLTFLLAGEIYGVNILRVQEIKGWTPVTRIPNTPGHIKGVINLRGTIIPVIDLRMRFNLEQTEYTKFTVVIVLSIQDGGNKRVVGIVVDGVSDVLDVDSKEIKPTPDFGTAVNTDFISGLAANEEKTVMLLDMDKLLSADEMNELASIS